jgi:hypothetical protein
MVFEDMDACLIMTSSEIFEKKAKDCVWRHFPAVFTEPSAKQPKDKVLSEQLELKSMPNLSARPHSRLESKIDGKILRIDSLHLLEKIGFPVSMLMSPVLKMNYENLGDIKEARFRFCGDVCEMTWREGLYKNTIECGMDGRPRQSQIRLSRLNLTASSTAAWENENSLCVWMQPLEAIGQRRIKFVFSDNKLLVYPGGVPSGETTMEYLAGFVGYFVKPKIVAKAATAVISKCEKIVEPIHIGGVKD